MPDIRTTFREGEGVFDFAVVNGDLEPDDGLETAVVLSIFTDGRAKVDDRLPDGLVSLPGSLPGVMSRRGWWGDLLATQTGDRIGSRLWLLSREKRTQETLNRAVEYVREALAWLIEDRVASRVDVEAEWAASSAGAVRDQLHIVVTIHRPNGVTFIGRFDYVWESV